MPQYQVRGANPRTGAEESIVVAAGDGEEARQAGRKRGLVVSSIAIVPDSSTDINYVAVHQRVVPKALPRFWYLIPVVLCGLLSGGTGYYIGVEKAKRMYESKIRAMEKDAQRTDRQPHDQR
jgi:hypothetical protein